MDMYTMAMSMGATQMAAGFPSLGTSTDPFGSSSADVSFAQLLSGLTGSGADLQSFATSGGYATMQEMGGLSWRDIQAGMMADAMKAITGSWQPVVTDPVLAGILQLMQSLGANGELDAGGEAEMLKLLEQLQSRVSEMLLENGAQIAGQQLLAVMQSLGGMMPNADMAGLVAAFGQTDGSGLLQMVLTTDAGDLLAMFTGNTRPKAEATGADFTQAMQSTAALAAPAGSAVPADSAASMAPAAGAVRPASEGQSAGVSPDTGQEQNTDGLPKADGGVVSAELRTAEPQKAESAFQSAVRTVKEQLGKAEPPTEESEETDIDALQKKVDAGTYLPNAAVRGETADLKTAQLPPAPQVQIAQGVQTALAAGNTQFTLTLAPENLGEVTIRLVQTAEGMRLDLIAKNPETQRLLADGLEMLRDNLRPLRVEVDSILTQRQDQMLNYQQHFDSQNRRNGRWNEAAPGANDGYDFAGEESYLDVAAAVALAPQGALNTYV